MAIQFTVSADLARDKIFWQLYVIFVLLSFCLYGLLANLVPMLIDRSMLRRLPP